MDLIDTHQHLIYRAALGYGWTAGVPVLAAGDFTLGDYQALTKGREVTGTIFMEAGVDDADYKAEARMVAALAQTPGSGILGLIASCRPEADMAGWLEECSGLGVVGFRRILHETSDDVSRSEGFRANVRAIGASGRPFDMVFLARQLPVACELARACPDMVLVLDHCGVPDIAGGGFAAWRAGISAVAECPNVVCKLSGISAYAGPGGATAERLGPYVDHVLTSFGPDRMLWGSDWPVVNIADGLPAWIDLTRQLLAGLSVDEQAAIGQGTARRVYGV